MAIRAFDSTRQRSRQGQRRRIARIMTVVGLLALGAGILIDRTDLSSPTPALTSVDGQSTGRADAGHPPANEHASSARQEHAAASNEALRAAEAADSAMHLPGLFAQQKSQRSHALFEVETVSTAVSLPQSASSNMPAKTIDIELEDDLY